MELQEKEEKRIKGYRKFCLERVQTKMVTINFRPNVI